MKTNVKIIIGCAIVIVIAVVVYFIVKNKTAKGQETKTKKAYSKNPNGINVRSEASTDSEILKKDVTGLVGTIEGNVKGSDGYTWYKIKTTDDVKGFVRSDVVTVK